MKSTILFLFAIVLTLSSFAQVPQKFNYQAVVRNNTGIIITNQNITVKVEILDSNITTVLYSETHAVTTNAQGLFSLQVGGGTVKSGVFANIDWSAGNRYISTSVDLTGGANFQLMGTSQLLSVPYALYAKDITLKVSLNGDTVQIGNRKIIIPGTSIANSVIEGLVAYYPFNGNANDESGNGNNGTVNGATLTSDRFGNINSAYSTNTNNQFIKTQSILQNIINTFTISFWANPEAIDIIKSQGIIGNEGNGIRSVIHPTHGSNWGNQKDNAGVGINVGINQIQVLEHTAFHISSPLVYNPPSNFSGWHHIVLVYNSHLPTLYVDGSLVKTGLISSNLYVRPSNGVDPIFYPNSGFGSSFTPNGATGITTGSYIGSMDEVRIYDRALTQVEITYLANH